MSAILHICLRSEFDFRRSSTLFFVSFFDRTNFLGLNEDFFQNPESSFEVQRGRLTLSGNLCHNIFDLYNFLGYRKSGTRDHSGTLARPYKNQKTETRDPIGTLKIV